MFIFIYLFSFFFLLELQALIKMLMTLVEGAYRRNGDTADANWSKDTGQRLRHRVTSSWRENTGANRKSLSASVTK